MKNIALTLTFLLVSTVTARASYFNFDTTDVNCSVLIRECYLTAGLWGQGDELGLFTPEGRCGGGTIVDGFPVGIAAWGDDVLTRDSIEGFREGDSMYFVRWDDSAEREIALRKIYLLTGDGIWRDRGLLIIELADNEPQFEIHPTLNRHRFICPSAEFYNWDVGIGPEAGDQAAIRTPDGDVAGLLIWATNDSATGWAFEDDPVTEDVVEGFSVGDSFQFSYLSVDSLYQVDSTNWLVLRGNEVFARNGNTTVRLWNISVSSVLEGVLPLQFEILGAFPNPFNGRTFISYALPRESKIIISVYSLDGRQVFSEHLGEITAGIHNIPIEIETLPSGKYLCKLESSFGVASISLALTR